MRSIVTTGWAKRGVFTSGSHGCRECTRGSGPGHLRETEGMEHGVNTIPWAERGNLRGCIWRPEDPAHQ